MKQLRCVETEGNDGYQILAITTDKYRSRSNSNTDDHFNVFPAGTQK